MRSAAPIHGADHLSRFTSVTVERRNGSGGIDSTGPASRIASRSRAASIDARDISMFDASAPYARLELGPSGGIFGPGIDRGRTRGRSVSRSRTVDDLGDMPEHLADE